MARNSLLPESIEIRSATLCSIAAEIYEAINFRTQLQTVPKLTPTPQLRNFSALLKRRGLSKPLLGTSETFYRCNITPITGYLRNQRKYIKLHVRRATRGAGDAFCLSFRCCQRVIVTANSALPGKGIAACFAKTKWHEKRWALRGSNNRRIKPSSIPALGWTGATFFAVQVSRGSKLFQKKLNKK